MDLDSLIRLKLKTAGPRDVMDVAALALLHPGAREQALAYRILDKLDLWLQDPRLQAQIAERRPSESPRRRRESSRKATRSQRRS